MWIHLPAWLSTLLHGPLSWLGVGTYDLEALGDGAYDWLGRIRAQTGDRAAL